MFNLEGEVAVAFDGEVEAGGSASPQRERTAISAWSNVPNPLTRKHTGHEGPGWTMVIGCAGHRRNGERRRGIENSQVLDGQLNCLPECSPDHGVEERGSHQSVQSTPEPIP